MNYSKVSALDPAISKTLKDLVAESKAESLLFFGSAYDGETWPKSDLDFFLFTPLSRESTAFYLEVSGKMLHFNVMTAENYLRALKNPLKRTLQSLLVHGEVLHDQRGRLKRWKRRLRSYPQQYRLSQCVERLEIILETDYALRKWHWLHGDAPWIGDPMPALAALAEIQLIRRGFWYGKSALTETESQEIVRKGVQCPSAMALVKYLESLWEPTFVEWVPLWLKMAFKRFSHLDCTRHSEAFGVDVLHIFERSVDRGWLVPCNRRTRNHGFWVQEKVWLRGNL